MTRYAEELVEDTASSAMFPLLQDLRVMVPLLSASSAALSIGYMESLLELHLQTFSISVSSVGLCFLAMSLTYTAMTLLTGYCVDKILQPSTFSLAGLLLLLLAMMLVGPAPYLPLGPCLPLTVLSLVLQGAGAALVLVSTYSSSLAASLAKDGYSDSPSTFSIVSGLWTSAFALGNFVGPSVAGVIYDQVFLLQTPYFYKINNYHADWFLMGRSLCPGGSACHDDIQHLDEKDRGEHRETSL